MNRELFIDDLVWMPKSPWRDESIGRVFDIRDHGIEVWVKTLSQPSRTYYTFSDQVEQFSVLDHLI